MDWTTEYTVDWDPPVRKISCLTYDPLTLAPLTDPLESEWAERKVRELVTSGVKLEPVSN